MQPKPDPLRIIVHGGRVFREIPASQGLTCSEFGALVGASDDTVRRWVKKGHVKKMDGFKEIRISTQEALSRLRPSA
jgi:hypothetical protein